MKFKEIVAIICSIFQCCKGKKEIKEQKSHEDEDDVREEDDAKISGAVKRFKIEYPAENPSLYLIEIFNEVEDFCNMRVRRVSLAGQE
ncbi:uncharacterized protein [Parasteatoda tepidariorum]